VVGQFDGGKISSDSGGLLLREVEQRSHIGSDWPGVLRIIGTRIRSSIRWSR
jgi:hypothetical protein